MRNRRNKQSSFMNEKVNRYSIRKYHVGTVSVAIGALLFVSGSNVAQAEVQANDSTSIATVESVAKQDSQQVGQTTVQAETVKLETTQGMKNSPVQRTKLDVSA